MVDIGSKTTRKIIDYKLSRYACYLIVMNGNPQKEIIGNPQKEIIALAKLILPFKQEI